MKKNSSLDALLSDICISTSAAPTYLPAYYFKTEDVAAGTVREFNLVDGGVAANNPVNNNYYYRKIFEGFGCFENMIFFSFKSAL